MTVMTATKGKILWVDDEIELLRSHILLLSEKGYNVETATNGEDAVQLVKERPFDLVFLDEMMAGIGGLRTLSMIKDIRPELPVVMITKNEDEGLMEEAIGVKISDYLTKPVNPSQVLLACKKFLEGRKITGAHVSRDYIKEFNEISIALQNNLTADEWTALYAKLVDRSLELDLHPELGLGQAKRPTLSVDIVEKYLIPQLQPGRSVFFFVIDCLRMDQWMMMESVLREYFDISREYYYSILPTATPYSRNAIF